MDNMVNIMTHPLISHKLTIMRNKNTSVKDFRECAHEVALLIGYEATKDLKLKDNLLIASIIRGGKSFIPGGDDCFMQGDTVIIVTAHSGFDNICDILC